MDADRDPVLRCVADDMTCLMLLNFCCVHLKIHSFLLYSVHTIIIVAFVFFWSVEHEAASHAVVEVEERRDNDKMAGWQEERKLASSELSDEYIHTRTCQCSARAISVTCNTIKPIL